MVNEPINVSVCYVTDTVEFLREVRLEAGATIADALKICGLAYAVPDLDLSAMAVGIYGKKKPLDTVLREHDRVEVYRGLIADPKHARRRRPAKKDS